MMAVWRRRKADARLHYSVQGSHRDRAQFQHVLGDGGVTVSMTRDRSVWDNSAMERFLSSLKIERINRKVYRTRA